MSDFPKPIKVEFHITNRINLFTDNRFIIQQTERPTSATK